MRTHTRIDPPKDGFAAANIVLSAAMKNEIEVKRIGSKLDSIEHATFNGDSPLTGDIPGHVNCVGTPLD